MRILIGGLAGMALAKKHVLVAECKQGDQDVK